jgi:hypothetical protein
MAATSAKRELSFQSSFYLEEEDAKREKASERERDGEREKRRWRERKEKMEREKREDGEGDDSERFLTSFFSSPPPSKKKTEKKRSYGMVVGAERALGPLVACGVEARKVVGSRRLIATAVFPGAAMPPPPPPSASAASASAASAASAALPPTPKPPRMIMSQVSEDDTDVDAPTARGALFMVDRAHLVASLARHVEEELSGSVSLHWGAPLASLDAAAQVARFGETGEEEQERRYDLLVACDGGSSAARRALEEAGLIEITELPSPVSLTDYKTFHGEEVFFLGEIVCAFSLALATPTPLSFLAFSPCIPCPPPPQFLSLHQVSTTPAPTSSVSTPLAAAPPLRCL